MNCVDALDFVPEGFSQRFLAAGFLNVTDPNTVLAFNGDTVATGTIFKGAAATIQYLRAGNVVTSQP
jgi:hypothetical protein